MSLLGWVACIGVGTACGVATGATTHSWLDGVVVSAVIGFLAGFGGANWERMWR